MQRTRAPRNMFDLVVPVHNAMHHARSCLGSLLAWADRPFHLYVVDDASDAYTATALRELLSDHDPAHWTLLTNETNRGYLESVNRGARSGSNPYIVFINSDTVTPLGALSKLAKAFAHDERIGVVNAVSNWANWTRICWSMPPGHNFHSLARAVETAGGGQYPDIGNASGFFFATRRKVFESVGGFDEAYGHGYWEEVDYCMKALSQQWRVVVDDRLYIFHHGWGTFREAARNAHMVRNRSIFMGRWGRAYKQLEARWHSKHPLPYVGPELVDGLENEPEALRRSSAPVPPASQAAGTDAAASEMLRKRLAPEGDKRVIFLVAKLVPTEKHLAIVQMVNGLLLRGFDANIVAMRSVDERIYAALPCLFRAYHFDGKATLPTEFPDMDVIVATDAETARIAATLSKARSDLHLLYWPAPLSPDEPSSDPELEQIDSWIAMSRQELRTQVAAGRRVEHISPGLPLDFFHPQDRPRKNHVLIIGGLESHPESVARIRRLCLALHHRRPELVFAVYGHLLSERAWPAPICDYGTAIDTQIVTQALNESKILVDLSEESACPWRALAAMACGTVAVVPHNGGQRDFAKHDFNAWTVDPSNMQEVVEGVLALLDDDARWHRLANQGMETARLYGLSKQCDRFAAVIADVVARH